MAVQGRYSILCQSGPLPAYVTLLSIFFGAPVVLHGCAAETLGATWKAQLAFIWRSISARQAEGENATRKGKR
ncbi:hypothetical protein Geob_2056 [Geotalea daltonii FRC-32]|uniref:Uncharacterized protein n=1 Tax=Geotalea daltonii (strain DSM 22248 / JCM 15807 / FRC-32) TaxID=316067 RepID=B9M8R5_GEODF|nr:hypothetical protein Geob_2056 [Geotalea daltonii FRC-32]